jgi:hypothetical protein
MGDAVTSDVALCEIDTTLVDDALSLADAQTELVLEACAVSVAGAPVALWKLDPVTRAALADGEIETVDVTLGGPKLALEGPEAEAQTLALLRLVLSLALPARAGGCRGSGLPKSTGSGRR